MLYLPYVSFLCDVRVFKLHAYITNTQREGSLNTSDKCVD